MRNPMIAGVLFMLLGEAIVSGIAVHASRWSLAAWFGAVWLVNTLYFKLSEESGLQQRFGAEYTACRAGVPMWVPRLKPWQPGPPDG